jgi:predicted transcriptional regulator
MAERDRDEESGKYTTEFEDEEFIATIEDLGGSASTTEVAESMGCDRRTAYIRLKELEDENQISSRKVGNSLLWLLPNS